jgi:hypothetical protein
MTDCRKLKNTSLRWPHTKFHMYLSINVKVEMQKAWMHEWTHVKHWYNTLPLSYSREKEARFKLLVTCYVNKLQVFSQSISLHMLLWQQTAQYILNSQTHTSFQLWCTLNSRHFIFHTQNCRQDERWPLSLNIKTICPTANFLQKLEISHLLEKRYALHRTWRFIMSLQPAAAPFPQSNDSTPHHHTMFHLQQL